jgi:predicted nucleotidyltransferase
MNLQLGFADFDSNSIEIVNGNPISNKKKKNSTINAIKEKRKFINKEKPNIRSKKIDNFLKSINSNDKVNNIGSMSDSDSDVESDVDINVDYLQKPYLQPTLKNDKHLENEHNRTLEYNNEYNLLNGENSELLQEQYQNYVPNNQSITNSQEVSGHKDVLIEKLNYMIHLLEEQQEEKTGHVTEELILYSFLGVFIIFVIDSFARASKYVR